MASVIQLAKRIWVPAAYAASFLILMYIAYFRTRKPNDYWNLRILYLYSIISLGFAIIWFKSVVRPSFKVAGLLGYLAIMGCCLAVYENPDERLGRNIRYLTQLAKLGSEYAKIHDRVPTGLDEIAGFAGGLPNRGDADGNPIHYERLDSKSFMIEDRSLSFLVKYSNGDVCVMLPTSLVSGTHFGTDQH